MRKGMRCLFIILMVVPFSLSHDTAFLAASPLDEEDLIESITRTSTHTNRHGEATTWFHPKACRLPSSRDGTPRILMTMQSIGGSDYFGPVHWTESSDLGKQWSSPQPVPALGREPLKAHPGLLSGVCDVVPEYHSPTGTILALGQVVFYRGSKFDSNDQLPRFPVYSVRSNDGTWSRRRVLEWNDPRGSFIYSNNCGQRVILPGGDILLALSFGHQSAHRSVASARCSFDGRTLKIVKVGKALTLKQGRGLLEPSLTYFNKQFYLTMRAEDGHGYHSVSPDGLHWAPMQAWSWEDGEPLPFSSTQQHWLTHSSGMFLVYTRRDPSNEGVIRWRSPLWLARVDPETRHLIRSSERMVFPLVGDGIKSPDQVALMGNYHVTHVTAMESWVTVGEWIPKEEARGNLLLARIHWRTPNRALGAGK